VPGAVSAEVLVGYVHASLVLGVVPKARRVDDLGANISFLRCRPADAIIAQSLCIETKNSPTPHPRSPQVAESIRRLRVSVRTLLKDPCWLRSSLTRQSGRQMIWANRLTIELLRILPT
jgi:hypothetical protein